MDKPSKNLYFMSRALALAKRGVGLASPGALVGAVLVRDGKVVGEGFYRYAETAHAEAIAIRKAGTKARGATLYVTLEPCAHFGRTAPCADLVIQSGVKIVVCAMRDPNPLVAGKGLRKLRQAGIKVEVGILEEDAARVNEAFLRYVTSKQPFVILKAAMTLDGRIAAAHQRRGSATWITSEASRVRVHEIRHAHDAVLVGINTILLDDPLLTDRSGRPRRRKLLRVVLDANLKVPLRSNLVRTAKEDVLIFCSSGASPAKLAALRRRGIQVVSGIYPQIASSREKTQSFNWKTVLRRLGTREIQSVVIEGGGETNWSAVKAGVVDKFHFFVAPKILGGHVHVPVFGGAGFPSLKNALRLSEITVERIAEDILVTGYPSRNHRH